MMRWAAVVVLGAMPGIVAAQDFKAPVIPILIGPSEDSDRVSVVVDKGLTSSKRLRTAELRAAREAMHNNETVSVAHLRALAGAGDGLAAQRYVRVLLADPAAKPSDIAYYSAVAVGTGRIWTLEPMIEAMHRLDPASEPRDRIRTYIRVLYPHAWAGNSAALDALVAFNGEGRLFGPLSDRTRNRILDEARKQGDGRIELGLAMGILEATRAGAETDPEALNEARGFLELAAASDHLAVSTTAENLLRMIDSS